MKVLHKFKRYITQKKMLRLDGIMLLLLLFSGYVWQRGSARYDLLPESEVNLTNPYLAQSDGRGSIYVVDDERSRVVIINSEGEVEYLLKGNPQEADTFSYVEDLEADPSGNIYLLDAGWADTGFAVAREAILVYDAQGRYMDTLLEITYEDEYVDKHKLFALTFWDQALYYVESGHEGFSVFRVSVQTKEVERVAFYEYENAFNLIQDYTLVKNCSAVYALDKRGRLIKGSDGVLTVLYDTAADPAYAGKSTFYRLVSGGHDSVFIADIKQNKLYRYTEGAESLKVFADQGQVLSLTATTAQDGSTFLGILLDSSIYMFHATFDDWEENNSAIVIPQISGDTFVKSSSYLLKETIYQLSVIAAVLSLLWLIARVMILLFSIKVSAVQKKGLLAAGTAAFVVALIVIQLLDQFAAIYREELISKLYVLAHTVSGMVDGDSLGRIRTSEDYMNEDYQALMAVLEKGLNREDEYVQEMYCNVLRYEDGRGFAIAYLDNSIGTYYPREEEEAMELAYIYETGQELQNETDDITGSYIYVCVPVLDGQGTVVGVIEVGTTTHVISNNIDRMRRSVLVNLTLVILIVLVLFGETISFFDRKAEYRKNADNEQGSGRSGVPLHLLRLSIFATYMAFNAASSFIPVYAAGFVTDDPGILGEFAASLPITLNLIFVGVTSVFCEPLLRHFSFRSVTAVSAGISMSGDLILFLGQNYTFLVLGLILNGIGVGLITNSINMFIAGAEQEDVKTEGFSLFNAGSLSGAACGMMLGASLAGVLGQRGVFCCSAFGWGLVMVLLLILGRYMGRARKAEKIGKKKVGAFLFSRGVIPYMLFIQFPYVLINSFVFYYVPIYGASQGFSESAVCLLLILNSLCSIYLSVAMTNYMNRKLKKGSLYLSSGLALSALLLFGIHSTVPMLLATLVILGIAGSFGISVRQTNFMGLGGVREYGEEPAMGIYNLMDNVGESAGRLLFGAIMNGVDSLPGLAAFAAVSGTLNGIYALIFRDKRRRGVGA